MALKTLPALREKKRYVVFRVHADKPVHYAQLKAAIVESLLEFMGERGFASSGARLIKNLWDSREGVLQTNPKSVDAVKVALALIHQIGEQPVAFQTLKVSGTIKSGRAAMKAPSGRCKT